MEIQDIIKSESDRLFIVDHECFILYTGDSVKDEKPFIRIGNWIDMPVDIIPLIENIIITDNILGNPSYEQFNIDIRSFASNRYIGSSQIIKRYLDFQKIFGLDLTNASIVNIEKDLPILSREKNISEKNHFAGIFYKDGNFKAEHNNNTILDLNEIEKRSITYVKIQNDLSDINKISERYDGSGIIILDQNPIFYHEKNFSSYFFPSKYFETFSRLGIDPDRIRELILPYSNIMNITKFLKWKNRVQSRIKIFSDNGNLFYSIKALFPNCTIHVENFNSLNHTRADGLQIINYQNSPNIKLIFNKIQQSASKLCIAFVKGSAGLKNIIKDNIDAIFASYSIFEETSILLKSANLPIAILDDGNKNISKLHGFDTNILYQGIHYEFQKHTSIEAVYSIIEIDDEIISVFKRESNELLDKIDSITQIVDNNNDFNYNKFLFNIVSLMRLTLFITRDRELSLKLKNILPGIQRKVDQSRLFSNSSRFKIIILFYNNLIFQFMQNYYAAVPQIYPDDINNVQDQHIQTYNRIIEDRGRLQNLINIYCNSSKYYFENKQEIDLLKEEINKRKEKYYANSTTYNDVDILVNSSKITAKSISQSLMCNAVKKYNICYKTFQEKIIPALEKNINNMPIQIKILLLIIFLLIFMMPFLINKSYTFNKSSLNFKEHKKLYNKYLEKQAKINNIKIRDKEIFAYANKVARKNGYNQISYAHFKGEKNPDWIYPSNIFILTDGEQVVIREGDTLWDISRKKLIEMTLHFNYTLLMIKKANPKQKKILIEKAKNYAFTKEHFDILDFLIKWKK